MPAVPYLLLDVFTRTQFEGNPLAVVIDPPPLSDSQMSSIAREFNLSETIFLSSDGPNRWRTRIFTPGTELPFAGHPTIGGSVALAISSQIDVAGGSPTDLVLAQRAGDVEVRLDADGPVGAPLVATLRAPLSPALTAAVASGQATAVLEALGLGTADAHPDLPIGVWSAGAAMVVVPVAEPEALTRLRVDTAKLAALTDDGLPPEFYVLAPVDAASGRWRARMFAPGIGIAEDPATGAAAVAAAGLLSTVAPEGMARWLIEQGVEMGRPSRLDLTAEVRSGVAVSAWLGGEAVLVGEGVLRLAD